MSNKGSDKNVGSMEDDIKILENMIEEYENCSVPEIDMQVNITFRERQADAIQNILSNYRRQKEMNEEHQKINGELREQVKELECENNEMKSLFEIQASIAKELEFSEKDKMIKFRGNFYIPDTMTVNAEIEKEKRIELSYVDVSRLLENRIIKS